MSKTRTLETYTPVNKAGDSMSGVHRFNSYLSIGKGPANNDQITWNAIPDNAGNYTPQWTGNSGAGGTIIGMPSGGNGGFEVRTLRFGTNNSPQAQSAYPIRFSITDDGIITTPSQPSYATEGTNYSQASNGWSKIVPNTELFDNVNNYDLASGRFTAPVAGRYMFGFVGLSYPHAAADVSQFHYRKNGSTFGNSIQFGGSSVNHALCAGSSFINLAAGDYVELWFYGASSAKAYAGQWNTYGHLLG